MTSTAGTFSTPPRTSAPASTDAASVLAPAAATRRGLRFRVAGQEVAAWHYPGSDGSCVVMAGGFAVTKEPATDLFAARLNAAGHGVLAFDYRRLGTSAGTPRQVVRVREQLADWQAAIEYAAALPGVDPARLVVWGFSATGGHVFRVAARNPQLAAAIAQTPNAGGLAAGRAAMRYQKPGAMLRLTARGILDAVGGLFGRAPLLVPLGGEPGEVAVLTTPDVADTQRALNPDGRYDDWMQQVAARSVLRLAAYRPGRVAGRIRCPLLVVVCDEDASAHPPAAVAAAHRAPDAEIVRLPGGHYAPFLASHEQAVAAQLDFLRRRLNRG
jgi:acetyl esterase/lipase